ncbi:MAG: flagellar biosynthesis protein FlgL, partial [Gammaproteobacteria bacterium]
YNVTDGSGAVIATGTYTAGESLNVGGASFVVDGNPANGDSFNLSPSTRRNVFDSLQGIVEALRRPSDSPAEQAALNNAMATSLDELDQSLDHVLQVRADVGTRMNHVDNQDALREHFDVALQENLSEVQDLDYAEAISKFNLQLTALQAAQQTFVKTQGLSLFNYL